MPDPDQAAGLVAVFDIDGVVADVRHRLRHVNGRPKNWAAFFAAADRDPPLAEGIALAKEYAQTHALVWLTGRPERLRRITECWLAAQELPHEVLFMRPNNDRRPSRDYKSAQLRTIGSLGSIAVVVDDDPEVVTRLKEQGWQAQLATWVPYEVPLAQEREGRT